MRKIIVISSFLAFFLVASNEINAQNTLKLRLSGNAARFMGEPQGEEVIYTLINDIIENEGPFSNFSHQGKFGLSAEMMLSLSENAWIGLELSTSNFKGENDNPPPYNFQYTNLNQLQVKILDIEESLRLPDVRYPLTYNTSMINLLANIRMYLSSEGMFRPFVKLHSGVSFIGTELSIKNSSDWPPNNYYVLVNGEVQNPENLNFGAPILFSRGTSTSPEGRIPALNLGGGVGFEVQINDRINFYTDYTYSMIRSDILDGRPNFDFNDETSLLERFTTFGNVGKFNFGICYTLTDGLNILGGSRGTTRGGSKSSKQHPHLPFYNIKRAR